MKVIFLDIDGVLNTEQTPVNKELDEFRIPILLKIIKKTGAKIVLNSSWNVGFVKDSGKLIPIRESTTELIKLFKKYGIEIYDITSKIDIVKNKML